MDRLEEAYRGSMASRMSLVGHPVRTNFTSKVWPRVVREPRVSTGCMRGLRGRGSGATRCRGVALADRNGEGTG